MSVNQAFLAILAVGALAIWTLYVKSIQWGLKRSGIAEVSFLKALGLFLLSMIGGAIAASAAGMAVMLAFGAVPEFVNNTVDIVAQLVGTCLLVAIIYGVRPLRAAKAVAPFAAMMLGCLAILIVVIRPLAYEAYRVPTNGMAPTILGEHCEARCPRCGAPAYGALSGERGRVSPDGIPMVCSKELRTVYVKDGPTERSGGDRVLACKWITPKRWDLIVFRYPQDISVAYVKRLVGLPGEKLEIRDGAVWINGEKLEPPPSIRGIQYSPTAHLHDREFSGPGSVPVTLGSDEYFVLGDFVDQSSDSRMWERGAPGYPPYAVPASHIIGVAINIYWPPNRWTSFR